jgi:hypothetical protein
MEPRQRPCPECGATAGVKYRTVSLDGVMTPVDPRLVCALGHTTPLPSELAFLREGDSVARRDQDEGLIG